MDDQLILEENDDNPNTYSSTPLAEDQNSKTTEDSLPDQESLNIPDDPASVDQTTNDSFPFTSLNEPLEQVQPSSDILSASLQKALMESQASPKEEKDSLISQNSAEVSTLSGPTSDKSILGAVSSTTPLEPSLPSNTNPDSSKLAEKPSLQAANPTKLANLKSVLSSVMKTSLSQVIRNKIDLKTPSTASKPEMKNENDSHMTERKVSHDISISKDISDDSVHSFDDALPDKPSLPQKARKSMSTSNPTSPSSSNNVLLDGSSQKANSKSSSSIKKNKKRHFKGGTYNLYLSSSKKRKKSSPRKSGLEQGSKDDCSSVTETTGTGSFVDSEEDVEMDSFASENYAPSDDASFQDESIGRSLNQQENVEEKKDHAFKDDNYNLERHPRALKNDMQDAAYVPLEEATIPESSTSEATLKADIKEDEAEEDEDELADDDEEVTPPKFIKPQELSKSENDQTSIASSVKTRLRLRRQHQDDNTEFEGGPTDSPNLSEHLVHKKARKSIPGSYSSKPSSPTEPVEFSPKVEYPEKLQTYPNCTCLNYPLELNVEATENENQYCQALDSLDEKLIGCCNTVSNHQLIRPAYKVPFVQMCDAHLWRLRHHHCCPGCGIFCTQGSFFKCSPETKDDKKQGQTIHLFHRKCSPQVEGGTYRCLHCNSTADISTVRLELNMPAAPVFYMSQKPLVSAPKAKMAFTRNSREPETEVEEVPSRSFKVPDTNKVFSSAGLPVGPDRTRLEQMIVSLANLPESIPDFVPQGDLYNPAQSGNFETILQLLVAGCDPNHKYEDHDNETALHAAAKSGQLMIIHLLLQGGASLDPLDSKLYTPFMHAVENRHLEVVKYLIKVGAHLDAKGDDGMTSLHLAAREGDVEVCKLLLDTAKLNVNIQDDGGWTPIVWASEHRHIDVIRLLLSRGADPTIRDNEENTALHWSSYSGSLEISHILLDCGCDLSAVNVHGDTPLHIAARQDNNDVVVLFLDRGADGSILNSENKTALMCCPDPSSDTWYSLKMNQELKRLTSKIVIRTERVMSTDISRGKELHPIQCVNGVDEEGPPTDYLYVIENCETSAMAVDRTVTSLQYCRCNDDCTTPACTCATISFKCWFDKDGILLPEFNMLDPPMIFECNRACLCWKSCNNRMIQHGVSCRLQLFRVEGKGWGVRALKDIPKGTFICEYVGEIITDSEADQREDDSYLFDLDNRDGETYCLDARHYGNISRFINHLCEPNIIPVKVFVDHQDLSFPRIAFFSYRDIKAFEELGFDYGEKFWVIKYKSFTCCCGSAKCKYSKTTIQDTLANYNRRLREEQSAEEASSVIPLA